MGLMTLAQAIGVIMGANIGTTVTAQLVAFKLTDIALPAIAIGVWLELFSKRKVFKNISSIILGFGFLFMGMQIMEGGLLPIAQTPEFNQIILTFSKYPILGVLVGFLTTAIVQSSSATIGLLQALALSGQIDIGFALPILFGVNIGTCITALISSIGANITAKKAAVLHLVFNIIGAFIFFFLYPIFTPIIIKTTADPVRQIANAHTLFNVANTAIQLPFANLLVGFVENIVPGEDVVIERGFKYIDRRFLNTPTIAFNQVTKEIIRMSKLAEENINDSIEVFLNYNERTIKTIYEKEEIINELERDISMFISELSRGGSLNATQQGKITGYYNNLNDIERVADHAKNIIELAEIKYEGNLPFTDIAINELNSMFDKVRTVFNSAVKAFENQDMHLAREVITYEKEIDEMEEKFRMHHIDRLNMGLCYPSSGVLYLDIISNLERVGDHATNIAHNVLDH